MVCPEHTAGLSQQGLTAAQLGPTLSVPPRRLETEGWKHCLLSPTARDLLSYQNLAPLYLIIDTSAPCLNPSSFLLGGNGESHNREFSKY